MAQELASEVEVSWMGRSSMKASTLPGQEESCAENGQKGVELHRGLQP
jgi:hypothetical protein